MFVRALVSLRLWFVILGPRWVAAWRGQAGQHCLRFWRIDGHNASWASATLGGEGQWQAFLCVATVGVPLHAAALARTGGMMDIIVADDPQSAFERILPHYAHQLNTYRAAAVAGTGRDAPREITVEKLRSGVTNNGQIPGLRVLTSDDAVAAIRDAITGSPVEHVYLWASVAGMPADLVERHIELVCTQVRPRL